MCRVAEQYFIQFPPIDVFVIIVRMSYVFAVGYVCAGAGDQSETDAHHHDKHGC